MTWVIASQYQGGSRALVPRSLGAAIGAARALQRTSVSHPPSSPISRIGAYPPPKFREGTGHPLPITQTHNDTKLLVLSIELQYPLLGLMWFEKVNQATTPGLRLNENQTVSIHNTDVLLKQKPTDC